MKHSFQLFSARNFQTEAVLGILREAGITEVEGFGPFYDDVSATRDLLENFGLTMPTGHFGLDWLEADPDGVLQAAKILKMESVIVPFLMPNERPQDYAGWEKFGDRLAKAGRPIVDAGYNFAWHNHDFEFQADQDGRYPQDALLSGADYIQVELDLAWVFVAGLNPIDMLERYKDRLIAVHVKDRAPQGENQNEDGWADLGQGQMDWAGIGKKLNAIGVERAVLEHDNPSDIRRFIENSLSTLQAL